jgi:hypothetical protein
MTLRRWVALGALASVVLWLHGWGAMQWLHAASASAARQTATVPARPAAVRLLPTPSSAEETVEASNPGAPAAARADAPWRSQEGLPAAAAVLLQAPAAAERVGDASQDAGAAPPGGQAPSGPARVMRTAYVAHDSLATHAQAPVSDAMAGAASDDVAVTTVAERPTQEDGEPKSSTRPLAALAADASDADAVKVPTAGAASAAGAAAGAWSTAQVDAIAAPPAAAPAERPSPTYRTRIPPAALVSYRMSRSGLSGTGELDWRPEAGGYSLRLEGRLPLIGTLITQTSRGRFDAAGLAPERYTDRRLSRGEQAASFQRSAGLISFSGQSPDVPLTPGVQDRLSVMVQLAAIAAGWSKPPPVGTPFQVRVVGARGDANVWSLRFEGPQTVDTPEGAVAALRFRREGDGPHDTRAEFWLDPARSHLPVRVRIADGSGDPLELLRIK